MIVLQLQGLDLSHNNFRDEYIKLLCNAKSLTCLNLRESRVTDAWMVDIAMALKVLLWLFTMKNHSQLTELDLSCNRIGLTGLDAIVTLLKSSSIRKLRIGSNDIGNAGIDAISRAMQVDLSRLYNPLGLAQLDRAGFDR